MLNLNCEPAPNMDTNGAVRTEKCERHIFERSEGVKHKILQTVLIGGGAIMLTLVVISAQEKEYAPSCKMCPGTYIPNSEIQAYVKRAIANQLTDQGIRQVDIGKANVGIAVVHRGKINNPQAVVAEHDLVSEVYHVIDGAATLVLGPDLVGKERRPANETTVRLLNGPGNNAKGMRNGVAYEIKAGDVVIIPAGTGHQFTKIDDHVTYLMVRVDPDKVTPHKTEADSKADLLTDGRTTAGGGRGAVSTPAGGGGRGNR
jgi:mannose-6-phosphate isomerase-like protein (cupin superfamily)